MISNGEVPEMYYYVMMRWSPWNGNNYFDIDMDGDSLINGIDVDMDADGMPDWWDQDEGSDGRLDVNNPQFGGSTDDGECDISLANFLVFGGPATEIVCGLRLSWLYAWPLLSARQTGQLIYTLPYSTRPDPEYDDGPYDGTDAPDNSPASSCDENCFHFDFTTDTPDPTAAVTYEQMKNNRDLFTAWIGINFGLFQWTSDQNANMFPDEVADLLDNDVIPMMTAAPYRRKYESIMYGQ